MYGNLTNEDAIRKSKQIDRTDATLAGFNAINSEELPLHDPTGEKTRKTYDFTRKHNNIITQRDACCDGRFPVYLADIFFCTQAAYK